MDMDNFKNDNNQDRLPSIKVPAKKRTYFFDIKKFEVKRNNYENSFSEERKDVKDYYLTITESKRIYPDDQAIKQSIKDNKDNKDKNYERHKIFIYREHLHKFREALEEIITEIEGLEKNDPR